MTYFTRKAGPALVPAYSARVLIALSFGLASDKKMLALLLKSKFSQLWPVSVLLVRWSRDWIDPAARREVDLVLGDLPVGNMLSILSAFGGSLKPAMQASYQADTDADLKKAGIKFATTIKTIGLSTLVSMLQSGDLMDKLTVTVSRIPTDLEILVNQIQQTAIESLQQEVGHKRLQRYEWGDYQVRATARTEISRIPPSSHTGTAIARREETIMTEAERAAAHLRYLGWSEQDIQELLDPSHR